MTFTALHNILGYITYVRDNDYPKAVQEFQKALDRQPDNIVALSSMVFIHECSDCDSEAQRWLECISKLPTGQSLTVKRETQAMFEKGYIYSRCGGDYQMAAERCLKQALQCDADNPVILSELTSVMTSRLKQPETTVCSFDENSAPDYIAEIAGYLVRLIDMDTGRGGYYTRVGEILEFSKVYENCGVWRDEFYKTHADKTAAACHKKASELSH